MQSLSRNPKPEIPCPFDPDFPGYPADVAQRLADRDYRPNRERASKTAATLFAALSKSGTFTPDDCPIDAVSIEAGLDTVAFFASAHRIASRTYSQGSVIANDVYRRFATAHAFARGLRIGGATKHSPVAVMGWCAYSIPLEPGFDISNPDETAKLYRVSLGQATPNRPSAPCSFVAFVDPKLQHASMPLAINPWTAEIVARLAGDPSVTAYARERVKSLGWMIFSHGQSGAWAVAEYFFDAATTAAWTEECACSAYVSGVMRAFEQTRAPLYDRLISEGASL